MGCRVLLVVIVVLVAIVYIFFSNLKTKLFCETSWIFALGNIRKATISRDFLSSWPWQHQRRNYSVRHLRFFTLTTSKTKQLCETSFKKMGCRADCLVPMCFAIFPLTLSKVVRLPRKSEARYEVYEVWHLSRKIIVANLRIWCSKMQPLSGNQRPDPNISDEHASCTAPATRNAPSQVFFKCPMPAIGFGHATKPSCLAHFWEGAKSLALFLAFSLGNELCATSGCPSSTTQLPKVLRRWGIHFEFKMCFAQKRRALFGPLKIPKVIGTWGVLYILTSKRASFHNGV